METYSVQNQRNRYHLYLSSADGEANTANGAGKVTYRNLRPQGYLFDPKDYRGSIVALGSFASAMVEADNYTDMCNNQQIGILGRQQGCAPFLRLNNISQPQSISNLHNVAGGSGVSNYSSNAGILKQLEWKPTSLQLPLQSGFTQLWYQSCEDPISNGIYTSSPLDELEIEIIDVNNVTMDFTGMGFDQAGTVMNLEYQLHIVIQPLMKDEAEF